MEVDDDAYDDVSYMQFLRKQIFSHPNYPRLQPFIQKILEGRHNLTIVNKREFLEGILNHMTTGGRIVPPIVKK